ncbi:hypothetical protein BHC53_05095 [Snodgrassella alvi]|nr:hypothetical protein BHC53_05095 [Snodgrassella alvi]
MTLPYNGIVRQYTFSIRYVLILLYADYALVQMRQLISGQDAIPEQILPAASADGICLIK